MKNYTRFVLILIASTLLQQVCAQINFSQGSTFTYLKGSAATATVAELLAASFDVTGWSSGPAPFRYGKGTGGTLLSDMKNSYSTFFLRTTFTVQNVERLKKITFTVNYDDAFVITLNGHAALSVNAPTTLTTTSYATTNHDPGTNETFTIDADGLGLVNGNNTLAVMVLNVSLGSSDIHFDVAMTAAPALPAFPYTGNVQFGKPGGFYSDVFDVTLSSPYTDCTILYTCDGSEPGTSATAVQGGTLTTVGVDPDQPVGRGTTPGYVLRACLIKSGYAPSFSVTNSYIFQDKIKSQTYPGGQWSSGSVNGQALDYAMASDVVNSTLYGPYLDAALNQIPSISIVTDMGNLFSVDSGIYVNAEKGGEAWERPCSVELIDTGNVRQFQVNAGLRIRGAASAKIKECAKRAFRFYFREDYGSSKLNYPLFEDEGASEFDCIDLRCEQNYSWSKDGSKYCSFISDIFSRDLQGEMGQPYKRGRYYHLYLNGMYWGLYQTDERAEADYAETYFGGDEDDYDVVKVNSEGWPYYDEVTDGTIDAWSALWIKCVAGFASNASYMALSGKLADGNTDPNGRVWVDIDNLIDYMLVIFYTGNFDAPVSRFYADDMPNNFYAIYNRNDYSKGFRFLAHDSEHSLFVDALYGDGIVENRVNLGSAGKMSISQMTDFNPQWLHYKLSANTEYKVRFMDRAYRHLTKGGVLTPEYTTLLYKSRAAQIDQAVIAESARWGDAMLSSSMTKQDWLTQTKSMYTQFFPQRTNIVKQQLLTEGLYTTMVTPDVLLGGVVFNLSYHRFSGSKSIQLVDSNARTIYYTLDGTDPRAIGGSVATGVLSGQGTVSLTLSKTMPLNARLYENGTWGPLKQVLFSQSDEDYADLKVTELHYHPEDSIVGTDTIEGQDFEFIEFKNTGSTSIDLTGLRLDSAIYHLFPDETLLDPGAFYVVASKPNRFYSRYGQYPSGNFSKNLSNSGETVVLYDRNDNVVISFTYDDKSSWPETPDGDGYSLTAREANPTGDPNDPAYWMASTYRNGSPFADDVNALVALDRQTIPDVAVHVYPNPTNGLFYIGTGQFQPYQVVLYDTKGTLLFRDRYENAAIIDLNRLHLPEGVYIVKVQLPEKMVTQKIIYMR